MSHSPGAPSRALSTSAIIKRLVAVALTTVATALGALAHAGPAAAHATRMATDPAENSQLTQSPTSVSATFSEDLNAEFAAMTVVGPDGNLWSTGEPRVDGRVVSVDVRPLGRAGTYTANYRVTSADGHVVSGSWEFVLTVAGPGTPGPSAAPTDTADESIPVWPFYVGAIVIVGAAAFWAVRRRS